VRGGGGWGGGGGGGGGGVLAGCTPPNRNLENIFTGTIISNVLRDVRFSRNQPLKSADG